MNTTVKLAVADLKQALPGLQKIISRHNTLPVLGCVRVTSDPGGSVQLRATNLEDFVTLTLPGQTPAEPFDGLIPFGPLLKIIKGYGPQEILAFLLEKEDLKVIHPASSSHLREKLEFIPPDQFPAFPALAPRETVPVGDEFKAAIQCAFGCASEDSTRRILAGAFVDVSDPKAHYIVGADGRRLFSANSFQLGFRESLILPHRKFLLWPGFMEDGDWRVGVIPPPQVNEPGYVMVQSNRWTLTTKQIEGTYPNWRQVIPGPGTEKTRVVFNEEAMRFICLAAPKLPGNDRGNQGIEGIATEGGAFLLRGKDGDHEASVPVTGAVVTGEPVRFCLNRQYLLQALKLGLNELGIVSPLEPVVFRYGGRRFLVAPLRPEADAPAPTPASETATPNQPQNPPVPETTDSSPEREFKPVEEPKEEMNTVTPVNRIAEAAQAAAPVQTPAPTSAFSQVREQIERIKETLKTVVSDLNETARLLGQVQKEKKTAEKEIEGIRDTLRTLQQVRI